MPTLLTVCVHRRVKPVTQRRLGLGLGLVRAVLPLQHTAPAHPSVEMGATGMPSLETSPLTISGLGKVADQLANADLAAAAEKANAANMQTGAEPDTVALAVDAAGASSMYEEADGQGAILAAGVDEATAAPESSKAQSAQGTRLKARDARARAQPAPYADDRGGGGGGGSLS
jgi:hypothetical protein